MVMVGQAMVDAVAAALGHRQEQTVAEVAELARVGRSTAGKALVELERRGQARRSLTTPRSNWDSVRLHAGTWRRPERGDPKRGRAGRLRGRHRSCTQAAAKPQEPARETMTLLWPSVK